MTNNKKKTCQTESSSLTNHNACHMPWRESCCCLGRLFPCRRRAEMCVRVDCSGHFTLWRGTQSCFRKNEIQGRHLFSLAFVVLKLWKYAVLDLVSMTKGFSLARIYCEILFSIFLTIQFLDLLDSLLSIGEALSTVKKCLTLSAKTTSYHALGIFGLLITLANGTSTLCRPCQLNIQRTLLQSQTPECIVP